MGSFHRITSIFYLLSPSFKKLKDFSFMEEDLGDTLEKLQPLSFKVSLPSEVYETLSAFQEMMLPELEKYKAFSSLKSIQEKRKVLFYILLHYLPEITEEMINSKY